MTGVREKTNRFADNRCSAQWHEFEIFATHSNSRLTNVFADPFSRSQLAHLGADIVKVEAAAGDLARQLRSDRELNRQIPMNIDGLKAGFLFKPGLLPPPARRLFFWSRSGNKKWER